MEENPVPVGAMLVSLKKVDEEIAFGSFDVEDGTSDDSPVPVGKIGVESLKKVDDGMGISVLKGISMVIVAVKLSKIDVSEDSPVPVGKRGVVSLKNVEGGNGISVLEGISEVSDSTELSGTEVSDDTLVPVGKAKDVSLKKVEDGIGTSVLEAMAVEGVSAELSGAEDDSSNGAPVPVGKDGDVSLKKVEEGTGISVLERISEDTELSVVDEDDSTDGTSDTEVEIAKVELSSAGARLVVEGHHPYGG